MKTKISQTTLLLIHNDEKMKNKTKYISAYIYITLQVNDSGKK